MTNNDLKTPFLSIIIPARNEERYVEAAIASVAGQSYPADRLECLVVDNGSGDRTVGVGEEFARRLADEGSALKVRVECEREPGVGRAKNRGAGAAQGDVLIFLDADSRMDPNLAHDVAAAWQSGDPAGSIRVLADSTHPVDRGFFALMEVGKVLFGIRSQMMYCDRALFLELGGFHPDLQLGEDLEFLKRVQRHVRDSGRGTVCHIRTSSIRTSPRRLRTHPFYLGMIPMFGRWFLAFLGIGRTRRY